MRAFQIAGLVLIVFALMGFITETGPLWARQTLLVLGAGGFALDFWFKNK